MRRVLISILCGWCLFILGCDSNTEDEVLTTISFDRIVVLGDCDPATNNPGDFLYAFGLDVLEDDAWHSVLAFDGNFRRNTGDQVRLSDFISLTVPDRAESQVRVHMQIEELDSGTLDLDASMIEEHPAAQPWNYVWTIRKRDAERGRDGCALDVEYSISVAIPDKDGDDAGPGEDPDGPSSPSCCKICSKGKACGNSCIARNLTCHQPPGCACNG